MLMFSASPGDAAPHGVPVHQGDGEDLGGRDHRDVQSHQGHDRQGGPVQGARHPRALQDHRRKGHT